MKNMPGKEGRMYKLIIKKKILKQLDKLSDKDFERIDETIMALKQNPRPHGVEKLDKTAYRIRIGRYRVIYDIYDKEKVIDIVKVAPRREDTYKRY